MSFASQVHDYLRDIEKRYGLRKHLLAAIPFWIGAAITGCTAVAYAEIFHWTESLALRFSEGQGYWILLTCPLFFLLSWSLVHFISPYASGSGIPQLMAASDLSSTNPDAVKRFLGFRVALIKILSSLVACLGGGAIGREGPTLQISGSIFYVIRRSIPASWGQSSLQGMILAGGGAGLAAAFNTPLGGIVYVVEELAKVHISSFRTNLLQSVIISGLVAQAFLGSYLYLGYPDLGTIDVHSILPAVFIGILIGAAGAFFAFCLKQIVIWRSTLTSLRAKGIQAALSGFVMACLIILCGKSSMGSGKEIIMSILFQREPTTWTDEIGRFFGPVITYGHGGAGGIFAPALSAGATLAVMFQGLFSASGPLLAILGMVAFLTAVTQSPFTSFVLVLEMTDRHTALFPMMVAALLAYMTSKLFSKHSFYEYVKDVQLAAIKGTHEKDSTG